MASQIAYKDYVAKWPLRKVEILEFTAAQETFLTLFSPTAMIDYYCKRAVLGPLTEFRAPTPGPCSDSGSVLTCPRGSRITECLRLSKVERPCGVLGRIMIEKIA